MAAQDPHQTKRPIVDFARHPDSYVHWKLEVDGPIASLWMQVDEHQSLDGHHDLVLNSYDLSVDIELADAVERVRFEHPEVRCLVFRSAIDRIFCAGANIRMLAASTHAFKVNFCKFTNETRLALEDASATSGIRSLAAVSGTASGGGYELALACDEILLVDDRSSAVSFPEVPLLGVLPGTGGLTRLVDKRKVRRDRADWFSTLAEGVKGRRAVQWGLVDAVAPLSRFGAAVDERAQALAIESPRKASGAGVPLPGIVPEMLGAGPDGADDGVGRGTWRYRWLTVDLDREARTATLTLKTPDAAGPADAAGIRGRGADWWPLRAFRALQDAICRLRFNEEEIGTWLLKTEGDTDVALAYDEALATLADSDWFVAETRGLIRRTLKRLETSARTSFALISQRSCFAGTLFELALAADRTYMLDDPDGGVAVALSAMNAGAYPMANGLSRLETRFLGEPEAVGRALERVGELLETPECEDLGLVTDAPDDLDWEDTIRVAIEERASLSPDALTGMEANLRFAGPETLETKIFGRLSAWQNWIFQRPNAVGEAGALTLYGHPRRPSFDWRRT